ncbi:hypothetical protein BLA3211_06889 [Burkholderia aenigmatica]|uniref:Uncharacterized protein n=1 Tax=Burkholderia aenigmatica TaxID=2015348 RepID=A0A6J5JKB6_9BURK|nr:hypothetical protein BLA3211_06889 [Burkholderia aenigmatica]
MKPMPLWKIWLITLIVALAYGALSNDDQPVVAVVATRGA